MNPGYLYIITNKSFPSWVKIGITANLKERLHLYQTCDPHRGFKIVYSLYHPKYKDAEKKIKEAMKAELNIMNDEQINKISEELKNEGQNLAQEGCT